MGEDPSGDMEAVAEEEEGLGQEPLPEEDELGEDEMPAVIPAEGEADGDADGDEAAEAEYQGLDDEPEISEHLKDAVEGSLRIKRLLSEDVEEGPAKIRRTMTIAQTKIEHILTKWQLLDDNLVRHVLECLPLEEITALAESGYVVEKFSQWKTPCELLAKHLAEVRERKLVGGGAIDCVASFRFRWKLSPEQDRLLRSLPHRRLRYVLQNYSGGSSAAASSANTPGGGAEGLEACVAEAEEYEPEDDAATENAVPDAPGVLAYGRYARLEIIDPTADCAVFGDANLTFSAKLAKHRKGLGHVGRVIATTFENLETLRQRYKEVDMVIKVLEDHYAEVYHGVDCTRIAIDSRFSGLAGSLGAVYYNFPHSGAIQGFFDGHPIVNWRHENLMRLFFRALRSFVRPGGSVKVASNMSALGVRYSYIMAGAAENEFVHVETVPFMEWSLHRYGRSYGDRRDAYKRPDAQKNESYNAQRAEADMLYCFIYKPSGETLPPQAIRSPPTLQTLMKCTEGPFANLRLEGRKKLARDLHKRFVMECSGTHVG